MNVSLTTGKNISETSKSHPLGAHDLGEEAGYISAQLERCNECFGRRRTVWRIVWAKGMVKSREHSRFWKLKRCAEWKGRVPISLCSVAGSSYTI